MKVAGLAPALASRILIEPSGSRVMATKPDEHSTVNRIAPVGLYPTAMVEIKVPGVIVPPEMTPATETIRPCLSA